MSIKQFLKPEQRKIAIFFAIIILEFVMILIFLYSFSYSAASDPYEECCLGHPYTTYCSEYWNMTEEKCSVEKVSREIEYNYRRITFILILILVLIINYLISCLIVWIYDKMKKKK